VGGEVGVVGGSNLCVIMLYRPVCRSWCHSSYIFSLVGLLVTRFQRISGLITIQAILCLS